MITIDNNSKTQSYEKRLEKILTGTNFGTWHHDFETDIVHYDVRAKMLLGTDKSCMNFDEWLTIVHPEDRDRVFDAIKTKIEQNKNHVNVIYRITSDIGIRIVKVDAFINYKCGQPDISYGLLQDITELVPHFDLSIGR